ncbi:MAG: hypothetical protein WD512_16840, partial [Candidatus Paceibacterota bacterium]
IRQIGLSTYCNDNEITNPHPQGHLNNTQIGLPSYTTCTNSRSFISLFKGVFFKVRTKPKWGFCSISFLEEIIPTTDSLKY